MCGSSSASGADVTNMTCILPDWKIEEYVQTGKLGIEPFNENNIQPHSYDITLGTEISIPSCEFRGERIYKHERTPIELPCDNGLYPFALGTTKEKITLPENICAMVCGKSTLGRLGLSLHQTAGWIDAGFCGNITLELSNANPDIPIRFESGMKIGQLVFIETLPARKPYGHEDLNSHYQYQTGVTEPRGLKDIYTPDKTI